jgi:hypothetical protein
MIGPQPPPPPPPPPPRPQQQPQPQEEGEPSSEEELRQYQGQPTSEGGMGRGGDTTAPAVVQQAVVQQRVDPAILQLWTDVGETLNRNQTGKTSFVFFCSCGEFDMVIVCYIVSPPPPSPLC